MTTDHQYFRVRPVLRHRRLQWVQIRPAVRANRHQRAEAKHGVPHTVIADNAGGHLMRRDEDMESY